MLNLSRYQFRGKVYKGRVLGFIPALMAGKSDKFGMQCVGKY